MLFYVLLAVHAENCDQFRQRCKINLINIVLRKIYRRKYQPFFIRLFHFQKILKIGSIHSFILQL